MIFKKWTSYWFPTLENVGLCEHNCLSTINHSNLDYNKNGLDQQN